MLAAREAPPFTVTAERQTGGVGRLGRPWSSPPGGWWFTVAVTLPSNRRTLRDDTGLSIAYSVCTTCEATLAGLTGRSPAPKLAIKWPNDIMAEDLKLAGILIEVVQAAGRVVALIGVGVNADIQIADLDPTVRERATTLRAIAGCGVHPGIARHALEYLPEKLQEAVERPRPRGVAAALVRERLWGVGRTVPITLPGGARIHGRIDGITDDGNLLATIKDEQHTFRSVDQIG